MTASTPMMAQYLALKAEAPGALLLFRMGDFYELFFDDARAAAATLDIALTRRGEHDGEPVPMCGVPAHALDAYLARLVRAGHHLAIAEQTEDPADARKRGGKTLVTRAITRRVTPGTITDAALLDGRAANWLAAAFIVGGSSGEAGLAWADVSTGQLFAERVEAAALEEAVARIAPAEWLMPDGQALAGATPQPRARFDANAAQRRLCERWGVATLDGFGAFGRAEVAALGALVAHLEANACGAPLRLDPPIRREAADTLRMDAATRASLAVTRGPDGTRDGSLLACVDHCVTGAGARLLAEDLAAPLTDVAAIEARLDMVAWFAGDAGLLGDTREALRRAPDLARALARLCGARGTPRDLADAADALVAAAALKAALTIAAEAGAPALLHATLAAIDPLPELAAQLRAALVPAPPASVADGGVISGGFDPALDELRLLAHDSRRAVAALEGRLRLATGVATLKVRHNNVIGYHLEVATRAADPLMAAGSGFRHRQTLAGVTRFDTEELAGLASRIAQATAHALAAEAAHVETLIHEVRAHADACSATAAALARLDVAASHADVALARDWARPALTADPCFAVTAGRHPVVEAARLAAGQPYVPNDCRLEGDTRLWLLTGPNMGGKSTFLRQNALIALLAQAGAFVPAAAATLGVADRLFSRVGASDDLARGRSTFMVEMVETAAILANATSRSLVILDEVGRGTSTWDGLALAWAIVERLHDGIGCRTLFATHYHELNALAARLPALASRQMRAREWRGELLFLHEVADGAAAGSYGLAVARLAGVPAPVLARAAQVLRGLESGAAAPDLPLFAAAPIASPPPDPLRERLAALRPDELTPRTALDLLYELKALAGDAIS